MARAPRDSQSNAKRDGSARIVLEGIGAEEARPELAITAWDRTGESIYETGVGADGAFEFSAGALDKATRVTIGPREADGELLSQLALTYRPDRFRELLQAGVINVGRGIWQNWFIFIRCVTGRVRVCHRSPWWYADLIRLAREPIASLQPSPSIAARGHALAHPSSVSAGALAEAMLPPQRLSPAASIDQLIFWPFRCAPVCEGTVQVYRRVCCCVPWVIYDPRLKDLLRELEAIVHGLPEPVPGPDPAPLQGVVSSAVPNAAAAFFKDGTLDEMTVRAAEDLTALRALPAEAVPAYVQARPYLFCRGYLCGTPVRVAQGELGPGGRFNICWRDFPIIVRPGCHVEYAYVVTQRFGPFTITIYNGIAANSWHAAGDDLTLTTFSPWARGCRDNPGGAFVFLDLIGDTGAHELVTPDAVSATAVAAPAYNSGLVFPAPTPAAAVGADLNRNWGGTLKLSYLFSEGMQDVGARYYRISVVEADASGQPTGTRHYLDAGLSWNKAVPDGGGGVDIVPVSLGPSSAGGENFLYQIPYDTNPTTDWLSGQYHGYLNTDDARWNDPTKRHLVMLEVFDASGRRLRPNGTPATGLGGTEVAAAFTYRRRYQATGATAEVPFGALTHMFWWDNRDVFADIVDLRRNGLVFNAECLFFGGAPGTSFGVGYRAYHPHEIFQLYHQVTWRRGLGSTAASSGTLQPQISVNVGVPPGPPGASATNTFQQMLRPDLDPTRLKCAFTAFLDIWNKRTDGDDLGHAHSGDTAAFVIEIDA